MMEAQGIGFWLTKRAFLNGNREALVDGRHRLSYRELNSRVNRLSRALQAQGLKPGDRCALLAYNCLEYVEVIFATAKLGLLLVPLNWRLSPAELAFNLSDSGTETLIFDPGFAEVVQGLVGQTPLRRRLILGGEETTGAPAYEKVLAGQSEQEPEPAEPVGLETPHIIMYTAGTTGRPKGAVLSQGASSGMPSTWKWTSISLPGTETYWSCPCFISEASGCSPCRCCTRGVRWSSSALSNRPKP